MPFLHPVIPHTSTVDNTSSLHPVQIVQNDLDIGKLKILRQLTDAVIKSFVAVFEVQLHIPPALPQS